MTYLISVIIGLVFAAACYKIADTKGRNAILFGILGFFFSLITLIVIVILPNKNKAVA